MEGVTNSENIVYTPLNFDRYENQIDKIIKGNAFR
jgi:hypothetical protein